MAESWLTYSMSAVRVMAAVAAATSSMALAIIRLKMASMKINRGVAAAVILKREEMAKSGGYIGGGYSAA